MNPKIRSLLAQIPPSPAADALQDALLEEHKFRLVVEEALMSAQYLLDGLSPGDIVRATGVPYKYAENAIARIFPTEFNKPTSEHL